MTFRLFSKNNHAKRKRRLDQLRQAWGAEVARERDMEAISSYHAMAKGQSREIDQQTWRDLDMDALFAKIDRTAGEPGRQVLYHQMRTYADDATLLDRRRQQTFLQEHPDDREECQLLLSHLDTPSSIWLARLLANPFPAAPTFAPLLYASGILPLVCLVGIPWVHALLLPALILMFINVAVSFTYGSSIKPFFTGFAQIVVLLNVGEKLSVRRSTEALPQVQFLRDKLSFMRRLRRKLSWLAMDRKALPDLIESAFAYLNMIFLFDTMVYLRAITVLRGHQAALLDIFAAVGSIDASIAVTSYLEEVPRFCRPSLSEGRCFDAVGLYHPLLASPISNDLAATNRSLLIAGPNMAGKTAFIRTVGLNVVLARTLGFCLAERAVLPAAEIRSAIRRDDDLQSGQSYFFAEIQQILDFIHRAQEENRLFIFLIDEIYRGTNTIERIAASTAVLRYLGQRQMVFATTHDLELQEFLADTFDMYHFSDQVTDGRYTFDYRLTSGPARTRNAIKLLELSGYPPAIVQEAEALAEKRPPAQNPPATRI